MRLRLTLTLLSCGLLLGCGTTKWTDTTRTATEQLLISDSMDRAVSRIDFRALAGKKVFVDDTPLKGVTDTAYLASVIRQHLLASGGKLQETKDKAEYVVEVRAGAVGTDHDDLLVGVPALTVPTVVPVPGIPTQIPEIPFVKRTNQRAVAKIAVFVYNRKTGRILWQSGIVPDESRTKALWVFGAGPFQSGSTYSGTKFAGDQFTIPLVDLDKQRDAHDVSISVAEQAFFVEPKEELTQATSGAGQSKGEPSEPADGKTKNTGSAPRPSTPGVVQASATSQPIHSETAANAASDAQRHGIEGDEHWGLGKRSLFDPPASLLDTNGCPSFPNWYDATWPEQRNGDDATRAPQDPSSATGPSRLPPVSDGTSEREQVTGMDPWPSYLR